MLNNSKIYRSGCPKRVIFYSQSSSGHEYNYGKPVVSITGRNSRHIVPNSSTERKLFSNIKHHPLPNSKRTINPDYASPQIKQFNNAKKYKWKNSTMDYTLCEQENKKIKPKIKISDKKNKTSEELKCDINNKNKDKKKNYKNCYSFYIKSKYDYNSEILNLPGGSKRIGNDIVDDFNKYKNVKEKLCLNTTANCFRKRDFNNSSCLTPFLKVNDQDLRNNITNLSNKNISLYNYNTKDNLVYNSNNITNDGYKVYYNNNKFKYNKAKSIRRNFFEASKDNSENNYKNEKFNNYQNNGLFKNYVKDSFKYKNNDLITHYSRKRNVNSYNKLFNEIHQENSNYSQIKYYGNNYSKRNYTQFELN